MDPIISKQRIASLILKENTVGLNEAEQEELNLWRQTDPRNERTYTRLHEIWQNGIGVPPPWCS